MSSLKGMEGPLSLLAAEVSRSAAAALATKKQQQQQQQQAAASRHTPSAPQTPLSGRGGCARARACVRVCVCVYVCVCTLDLCFAKFVRGTSKL